MLRCCERVAGAWAVMRSLDETLSKTLSDSCVHGLNECGKTQILGQSGCSPQGLSQVVIAQSVQTEATAPFEVMKLFVDIGKA